MFDTRTRLLFFACLKDAAPAGAALKVAAPQHCVNQTKVMFENFDSAVSCVQDTAESKL